MMAPSCITTALAITMPAYSASSAKIQLDSQQVTRIYSLTPTIAQRISVIQAGTLFRWQRSQARFAQRERWRVRPLIIVLLEENRPLSVYSEALPLDVLQVSCSGGGSGLRLRLQFRARC